MLLLDKPPGFSSTQALARSKLFLEARKAGHTGTLDPFATGLLPLAFGEATKFSRFLTDSAKTYVATLQLGVESTTGDPEGKLTPQREVDVNYDQIEEILVHFMGVQDQIPPMHSAIHVNGRRLYELAREGLEVERAARRIEISELRQVSREGTQLTLEVTCSKGTYVRTLAMDIGKSLGCGAYLTGLRRTKVGGFHLDQAIDLDALKELGVENARARLLPVDVLVRDLPRQECSADLALRFTQGQVVHLDGASPGVEYALFGPAGVLLGVGRCEAPARVSPLRLMATAGAAKLPDFA
ncbi:MAG: tRNA pseudouridine(55) synthase TruB [Usitatibacter sp.]